MRSKLRTALSIAVLALSAAIAPASADAAPDIGVRSFGAPLFSSLGTRDGLPNASVSSIAQDALGFLWFGTQGGLVRYDGYSFKLFAHEPFDTASLPHDLVQTIFLDGGALWAGTYGGLSRLDLKTERFLSYANDPEREDSLSNDVVTCISRDAKGSLWVGTLSGLNRLDEATGKFRRFRHDPADPASLPADVVRAIKVDRDGRLWIGTSGGGLARFDYARQGFVSYRKGVANGVSDGSILSDYVMAIDQDSSGRIWVGSWYGGLSLFDPVSGRFENHPVADDRVYSVCAAEDGVVYVGTWGGGLFEYSIASKSFVRYRASGASGSLSNDVVYSLLRDVSGELWIGTNGGGLCKLSRSRRSVEAVSASNAGMPAGKVYAVLIDRRGYLWVGVYNEGLARRDPATGAWRRYRHEEGNPGSLPNDIVNFLHEDARGELWAGTNGGLARYDRASDSFRTMPSGAGGPESLSSEIIFAMADEGRDGEWIGTFRSGLDYWDRASGKIEHFAHESGRDGSLSDNLVNAIGRDGTGRLWVGTNNGLDRLEGVASASGARFAAYFYDPTKPGGISSDSIRSIFLDSRKILWIGSAGGGLMRYEPETDSFVIYTKRDGLPSNTILSILEDAKGNLWIATQTGLAIYDRAGGRFRGLSVYSDLTSAEFFSGAFAAPDGSLFFGAFDRLYRFDPATFEFNGHRPPIALTSVSAKGRPALGAAALANLSRLDLSWRGNSLSIEFAALDYRDSARNRYSYRLEGFDDEWSPPGSGHSATYTNLPGGNYVFHVRASNNDGLWNEEGIALPVRVRRAPWASPWAFALYAVILAGGGYALARRSSRAAFSALRAEAENLRAKLVAASASMESAAIVDSLTGLPNRRKAEEYIQLALSRAARAKLDLAVLMVDIDHFKSYNDRYGKAAGNECLRRIAGALSACVRRSSDIVARYGGEEFLIVLEETSLEGALSEGEAARRAVEALEIRRGDSHGSDGRGEDGHGGIVTVSVGCASMQPDAGQSPAALISEAEKALMAAKMLGRNRSSA
jgi:diguanylate cyclase (GGDEF)-like protein